VHLKIYKIVTIVKVSLRSQLVTSGCPPHKKGNDSQMFLQNTVIQRITEIYQNLKLCREPHTITTEWVTSNPDNPSGHQKLRDKIPACRLNGDKIPNQKSSKPNHIPHPAFQSFSKRNSNGWIFKLAHSI